MATQETQQLDEIIVSTRRKMLTLGGAALASMAFSSVAKAQTALVDADYLNFALNLEYLEAQFYTLATSGKLINDASFGLGIGAGASVTGPGTVATKGSNNYASCLVPFTNKLVMQYATETAGEERNHVKFLRSALAASAVAMPNLDLVNSFNGLATLLGLGLTSFDPFADDASFLLGAYIFEDVGVTAYTGAAPALTTPAYLDAAAGIQGVEAYHAGLIRTTIYGLDQNPAGNKVGALGTVPPGTLSKVATAISALRASVDGANATKAGATMGNDIGIGTQVVTLGGNSTYTASTITNASTTSSINTPVSPATTTGSLTFARTAQQVLNIVYASAAGKAGGFFPNGLNGNVK